jgi:hypothetical protein
MNRCGVDAGCEPLGERPEELSIVDCRLLIVNDELSVSSERRGEC